jgi:hypothetical protein
MFDIKPDLFIAGSARRCSPGLSNVLAGILRLTELPGRVYENGYAD